MIEYKRMGLNLVPNRKWAIVAITIVPSSECIDILLGNTLLTLNSIPGVHADPRHVFQIFFHIGTIYTTFIFMYLFVSMLSPFSVKIYFSNATIFSKYFFVWGPYGPQQITERYLSYLLF